VYRLREGAGGDYPNVICDVNSDEPPGNSREEDAEGVSQFFGQDLAGFQNPPGLWPKIWDGPDAESGEEARCLLVIYHTN
jgi:hypothetical protein